MNLLRFLPLLLLLCGCAREVSPVSALALDCKNGMYCLTAEVVRQDSPDDTAAPAYLSATGTDVTDALRNLRSILPGDLYLSHAQVLLLSEDAVSESILPLADYLCRENDVRLSLRAAVVRDGSAAELLENDNEVYALSELLDRSAQDGVLAVPRHRCAARRRHGHSSGLARGCVRTDSTGRHGSVQKRTAELLFRR